MWANKKSWQPSQRASASRLPKNFRLKTEKERLIMLKRNIVSLFAFFVLLGILGSTQARAQVGIDSSVRVPVNNGEQILNAPLDVLSPRGDRVWSATTRTCNCPQIPGAPKMDIVRAVLGANGDSSSSDYVSYVIYQPDVRDYKFAPVSTGHGGYRLSRFSEGEWQVFAEFRVKPEGVYPFIYGETEMSGFHGGLNPWSADAALSGKKTDFVKLVFPPSEALLIEMSKYDGEGSIGMIVAGITADVTPEVNSSRKSTQSKTVVADAEVDLPYVFSEDEFLTLIDQRVDEGQVGFVLDFNANTPTDMYRYQERFQNQSVRAVTNPFASKNDRLIGASVRIALLFRAGAAFANTTRLSSFRVNGLPLTFDALDVHNAEGQLVVTLRPQSNLQDLELAFRTLGKGASANSERAKAENAEKRWKLFTQVAYPLLEKRPFAQ